MAIEVTKTDEDEEGGTVSDKGKVTIRERIFTDAAGEVAVAESDPRAAFLFSTPGKRVDRDQAERLGIDRNGRVTEPTSEEEPPSETEEERVAREEREEEEAKVAADAEAAAKAAEEKQAEKRPDKGLLGRAKNKGKSE